MWPVWCYSPWNAVFTEVTQGLPIIDTLLPLEDISDFLIHSTTLSVKLIPNIAGLQVDARKLSYTIKITPVRILLLFEHAGALHNCSPYQRIAICNAVRIPSLVLYRKITMLLSSTPASKVSCLCS